MKQRLVLSNSHWGRGGGEEGRKWKEEEGKADGVLRKGYVKVEVHA